MLSILIPTYNYNARTLVTDLRDLAYRENISFEIIVGDDASTEEREWIDEVAQWKRVRVVHSPANEGRAYICNRMAKAAHGDWLLFVDSDARVDYDFSFLPYLQVIRKAKAVCGGLRTPPENPNPRGTLRYKYERSADRYRLAAQRSAHPNRQLSTFNFLVKAKLFHEVGGFDERCTEYGYEDMLFGVVLESHGIQITHIENPLVHMGIDTNEEFLGKTETALRTLHKLGGKATDYSTLAQTAKWLRKRGLAPATLKIFNSSRNLIRRNLLSRHPSLHLFQFYKLCYFMTLE